MTRGQRGLRGAAPTDVQPVEEPEEGGIEEVEAGRRGESGENFPRRGAYCWPLSCSCGRSVVP